jgi:hypothetical protein
VWFNITNMTDNKCANPEYSLEVDEMIMEYLLYNTTKAHLHNFGSRQRPEDDNHGLSAESAATLLQVFDQFLQLFKLNHVSYDFSPDTEFSIKLLQFVVLFTHRKSPEVLSPSAREQLKQLSKQNAVIRIKRWDTSCSNHGPSSAEERIFDSWRDFFALPGSAVSREQTDLPGNIHAEEADFISLLDLLPKFLDLSADMAANLGQDVTEQWMFLAAEFMLQSAWEKYVYLDADPNEQPLIIAFGWGRWDRGEELDNALTRADVSEEVKAMEVRVDAMFSTSDESSGEATGQEIPEWTKIRLEHLSTFGNLPQGMEAGKHAQRWQVKQLRKIADLFPAEVFDGKVMDYLEGLWKLGRKPLLVQIEQGKIEGLTKEDFDGFMQNVFPKGPGSQEIGQSGKWWS